MAEEFVYKIAKGQLDLPTISQILSTLSEPTLSLVVQDIIDTFSKRDRLSERDILSHQKVLEVALHRSIITPEKDLQWIFDKDKRAVLWISAIRACATLPPEQAQLEKIRMLFARKVERSSRFWGYYYLERFYAYLIAKDKQFEDRFQKDAHEKETAAVIVVSDFLTENPRFLPPGFDFRDILIRYICMLRYEVETERPLIESLISRVLKISSKNLTGLRFCFEFFRYSFDDKTSPYLPQAALFQLIRKLTVEQINREIDNTFIGMIWSDENYRMSIKNLLKVGILPSSVAIIMKVKDNALRNNQIEPLIQMVEGDIFIALVYLKFDNLFPSSMKLLKEFVLGAPPRSKTFEKVVEKSESMLCTVSPKNRPEVIQFLEAVKLKYENFCSVQELELVLSAKVPSQRLQTKKVQECLEKYDWVSFEAKQGQQLQASKTSAHFRGLCNIGNTCYMNSFLQALYMTREFRFQVLDLGITAREKHLLDRHKEKDIDFKRKELKLIRERMAPLVQLQKLFALLYKSKRPYINPSFFKNILPVQFRNFFQQDAGEFGRIFLSEIQEVEEHLCFEGTSEIIIQCQECKGQRKRSEKFLDLMLSPCPGDDVQSLKKMIEKHDQPEELEGLECERCAKAVEKSTKRTRIGRLPPYLVITLNRFTYSLEQKKKLKLDFRVDIPESITLQEHSGEMISEHPYDLYAIIVHRGTSAQSGHYFAFTRTDTLQQTWVCFDDSTITRLDCFERVNELVASAPNDTPYILFYQNRQHIEKLAKEKFFTTPFILSQKLTSLIEKQDIEYMKESQKTKFTLPKVKIPYSFFIKKDEDDDDMSRGGGGGNNLIM